MNQSHPLTFIPNRIREWRSSRRLSMQALAERAGTTRAQIDKLERGERRLTVDWLQRLATALECHPADLLPPAKDTAALVPSTPAPPSPQNLAALVAAPSPYGLLPVRSAARGGAEQEMFLTDGPIDYIARPPLVAHVRDAYAMLVVGTSMVPMFREGQLLIVHPHRPPQPNAGVVVTKNNGAVLIKEYVRTRPGAVLLWEYQPASRELVVAETDIRDLHAVIGVQEP